ncbi:MAG: heme-binding protein [Clostridiaceae bacterium]
MAIYETAPYEVLKKDGKFEIRSYEELITVGVKENNLVSGNGFGSIFQYISGDNENREKISMTTPVINELNEEGVTTEFVMPRRYNASTLPKPENKNLSIKKLESRTVLAITFNGSINDQRLRFYKKLLLDYAKKNSLTTTGIFRLARYNPPFIPSFLRRNELLIDLKGYETNSTSS